MNVFYNKTVLSQDVVEAASQVLQPWRASEKHAQQVSDLFTRSLCVISSLHFGECYLLHPILLTPNVPCC